MSTKKVGIILGVLVVLFLLLRIFGVDIPLHQDEYKWSFIADSRGMQVENEIPHPPLGKFIYSSLLPLVGQGGLRLIPVMFSLVNLFLIYYLAKIALGKKAAIWTAILFTVSFFSILASLMIDTDGTMMPLFALLSFIFYFKYKELDKKVFLLPLLGALALGFLIKVSFALVPLAIAFDFAIHKGVFGNRRNLLRYCVYGVLVVIGAGVLLFLSKFVFPSFDLVFSLKYWENFINFESRAWFQTLIQFVKALLYASPLLLAPLLFVDKDIFSKTRVLYLFMIFGLFFYLLVFDFSIGALDRYLQFIVVPLCVIVGGVLAKYISFDKKGEMIWPIIISGLILSLQFFPHFVPSLYPKTEWISRMMSLKWNFLFPFFGGSGPTPFYVSFLFIAMMWVVSSVVVIVALMKKEARRGAILGIFILGVVYNGVFAEEYLFGKINGNSGQLIKDANTFIVNNSDIKKVTVYNDNGGNEIVRSGKYRKRLYVDPKFDIQEKIKNLNLYKEHYLVIDIPHLDEASVYAEYFNTCEVIYRKVSGKISSTIYDCKNAPDIKE